MKRLLDKYAAKLVSAGIVDPGDPLIGGLDADLVWNRDDPATAVLETVVEGLSINSILFSRPARPYRDIIDFLGSGVDLIKPEDSETRTFMHDLPVIREFDAHLIIDKLRERKSVIIPQKGIITWGTVSPEQAFIFYSSVCFACFVKFFSDFLRDTLSGDVSDDQRRVFKSVLDHLDEYPERTPELMRAPFLTEDEVYRAIAQAGRMTVDCRLVDSFFGNISLKWNDTLYISQTTSSLDELEGCIVPCPLDGSSCVSITASSEFPSHMDILRMTGMNAILHGHPKFAVIMSMHCPVRENCPQRDRCHLRCPEERFIRDIPVVPGEVGTGPWGLCNTLPPALAGRRGAIVVGHGLFTISRDDFNTSFEHLLSIECMCRTEYFKMLENLTN